MHYINPFYEKQPSLLFVDELKSPLHKEKPTWFKSGTPKDGETSANGIYIVNRFPDETHLLDTAMDDFETFSKIYEIAGTRYPLYLVFGETSCFEEYTVTVTEDSCTITAADTEGIRRGIIYIEDEMHRREGAYLPVGKITRTPRIKARITRGFFSPTNRPPKNIDELMDDVDYYPDAYLNRLAHDGTNGLWIYSRLADLVKTDIIPEYGDGAEQRISKLNRIIARCKRYGIGVYVFFIDPAFLTEELAQKHPDIAGVKVQDRFTFCTHTERGRSYCIEAMEKLCKSLPDVAGFINLSYGERPTTCASGDHTLCPNCRTYKKSEIVAYTTNLMKEGIRRAGSKADFISWTYGYRYWTEELTSDFVHHCDNDVCILENFEEMGINPQLGKDRLAVDYWLSYKGPSDLYKAASDMAKTENKSMYAKLQVCCSHEVATVPYVPVPGILFDKFSEEMQGVMECWYFGNYPSLMSKAAGELAFLHDFSRKDDFLKQLAAIYCGRTHADQLAEAFRYFEQSYTQYPTNIMFSYYGPMHDGVVWELQLLPKNNPLPRTWLFLDTPDGDRLYECMLLNHSETEVVSLLSDMKEKWEKGLSMLPETVPEEMKSVSSALSCLIESSFNNIKFYTLRFLLNDSDNKTAVLNEMEQLVLAEIENSKRMIPICQNDPRLGYHSEAENFKFFPAQIRKRICVLETLLKTEFETVRNRIDKGETPLDWNVGYSDKTYKITNASETSEKTPIADENAFFRVWEDDTHLHLELEGLKDTAFVIGFEAFPMHPTANISFQSGVKDLDNLLYTGLWGKRLQDELSKYDCLYSTTETKDIYRITVKKSDIGVRNGYPIRFRISANGKHWAIAHSPAYRLGLQFEPCEYGTFV